MDRSHLSPENETQNNHVETNNKTELNSGHSRNSLNSEGVAGDRVQYISQRLSQGYANTESHTNTQNNANVQGNTNTTSSAASIPPSLSTQVRPRNLMVNRGQMPPTSLCSPPDDLEDDSERESGDNSAGEVDSDTKHLHDILNKDLHQRIQKPNRQKHHRTSGIRMRGDYNTGINYQMNNQMNDESKSQVINGYGNSTIISSNFGGYTQNRDQHQSQDQNQSRHDQNNRNLSNPNPNKSNQNNPNYFNPQSSNQSHRTDSSNALVILQSSQHNNTTSSNNTPSAYK